MIGDHTGYSIIETARVDRGLKLLVASLQIMIVKPQVQFLPLFGRQRSNGAFDLLHRVQGHSLTFNLTEADYHAELRAGKGEKPKNERVKFGNLCIKVSPECLECLLSTHLTM